jgi:hypothetical protein
MGLRKGGGFLSLVLETYRKVKAAIENSRVVPAYEILATIRKNEFFLNSESHFIII